MFLSITTPEHLHIQPNSLRIKAGLTSGVLEIYNKHQDLIGKIDNNFLEVDSINENKEEKSFYILQDAIFVVSNQNFEEETNASQTSIYVYAKKLLEISKNFSSDLILKELDEKKKELENQMEKLKNESDEDNNFDMLTSKILILKDDVIFLEKAYSFLKEKIK